MKRHISLLLFIALLILPVFRVPANAAATDTADELAFLSEKGVKIGVSSGTVQESMIEQLYPDAERCYFDNFSGYEAVAQGKIDAFVYDWKQMELAIKNGQDGVRLLDSTIGEPTRIAFGLSNTSAIPDLENIVNNFLSELRADGTLDDMYERWVESADYTMPDIPKAENPDLHLIVGTTADVPPYSFYEGSTITGHDIELIYRFAAKINADVEFKVFDWNSIIAAIQSGKVDMIASNLQITAERSEAITFSDVIFEERNGVMVRDTGNAAGNSFVDSIKSSFEKTFIREGRYRLFISGILTTLLITALSVIFGTILGFLLYMACRKGNPLVERITGFFVWLIQGMPVVVLLMILYYIIFANAPISGTVVAVIAFSVLFATIVFNTIRQGVSTVESGQTEAALSLGYNDRSTFYRIILPQALPHCFPSYKGEVNALVKATAIVGYIAVQDLTKMGDIVRSRTYEAFFPLIAVAVIYFIIEALFTFILNRIETLVIPRR